MVPRPCRSAVVLALLTAACSSPPPGPKPERALRVLMGVEPTHLDPHTAFDDVSTLALANTYGTLVRFDANLQLSPSLALRWINPDDRTWRFHLDPEARFPDGSRLQAGDVKFSLERLRSISGSQLTGFVRHVAAIEVVDAHTIDLRTERPVAILNGLALIPIVSEAHTRKVGDESLATQPFGTGPYRLERWEKGRQMVFVANPHHPRKPSIARAVVELRPNGPQLSDLAALDPDLTLYPGRKLLDELDRNADARYELLAAQGLYTYYVSLNVRPTIPGVVAKNALAEPRVRRALALALDPRLLVAPPLRGMSPAWQLTVPQVFGFDPSIPQRGADLQAARALLAEAGQPAPEVVLDVLAGSPATLEKRILEQWLAIGVRGRLRELSPEAATQAVAEGRFQATTEGYGCTSADSGELLTYLLHTRDPEKGYGAGNSAGYSNPEVDRLTEQNLSVLDPRQRQRVLQETLRIALRDAVYVPLVVVRETYVKRRGIAWVPPIHAELRFDEVQLPEVEAP
jgi:peptide/nickel transport system substrate-binding protein